MTIRDHLRQAFAHLPPAVRRQVLHGLGRYAPWEPDFDFTPPPLPSGQCSGPPDFVGIGAQKAGTTWWYERIIAHPDIYTPPGVHKERHFFDRFGARTMRSADVAAYHGWFPRPPARKAGEWTPDYLAYPWVARLLARSAPDTRLLVLLRDPVERFRSGLAHRVRLGMPVDGNAMADAVARGHYRAALDVWSEHFDPRQLLVLQYERCMANPAPELERTFAHIGLSAMTAAAEAVPARSPPAGRAREELGADVVDFLIDLYEPGVVAVGALVPDLDLGLWPNFAYLADSDRSSGSSSPSSRR